MTPWRRALVACTMLCLTAQSHGQSEEEQTRAQLTELKREMLRVTREISSEKARKDTLQEQLREAELTLATLAQSIRKNQRDLVDAQNQLSALEGQRAELVIAKNSQQKSIARELKSAYQMGRQGQVKLLLSQEQPDTVARNMAYYRYFLAARNEAIAGYRETLVQIAALESQISALSQQLTRTGLTLASQQRRLSKAQANREQAVASLALSIQNKGGALQQMETDRGELERLLEAIEVAVVNLLLPDNFKAFKTAKGKMPWPVDGKKPSNKYGKYRNEGKMRWQGVSIPAREGTSVTAIHHGRVVYADWFRGSGLLLIIDHGEGYMSLYAHNQTLLKEVGEWVTAGTPVSTVGNSGGQTNAALYFEIRHQGKPTNPANWCRG